MSPDMRRIAAAHVARHASRSVTARKAATETSSIAPSVKAMKTRMVTPVR
jgi:hypothetical protein